MLIHVFQKETTLGKIDKPITTEMIIAEMNKKFTTKEQFECRLYVICVDIAQLFNMVFYNTYDKDGQEILVFTSSSISYYSHSAKILKKSIVAKGGQMYSMIHRTDNAKRW